MAAPALRTLTPGAITQTASSSKRGLACHTVSLAVLVRGDLQVFTSVIPRLRRGLVLHEESVRILSAGQGRYLGDGSC